MFSNKRSNHCFQMTLPISQTDIFRKFRPSRDDVEDPAAAVKLSGAPYGTSTGLLLVDTQSTMSLLAEKTILG